MLRWLREDDPARLEGLWSRADAARRRGVGDAVHLRGLIEFSNRCVRLCAYCGLRAGNRLLARYRMSGAQILAAARRAARLGMGTVVLQSGEDPSTEAAWLADVVRRLKADPATAPLAVTLSVGERDEADYALWRQVGADRYLLRFETSRPDLLARIHPSAPGRGTGRVAILRSLRRMGYEIGTGMLVGVPGQTFDDLADDLELLGRLDPEMIGLGPYIPHPRTPLAAAPPAGDQVPATPEMAYKALAIARLLCPRANIPATTAVATLDARAGYDLGLARGANVIMPNVTPARFRALYEVYPGKRGSRGARGDHEEIRRRVEAAGRAVGTGRGDGPRRITAAVGAEKIA